MDIKINNTEEAKQDASTLISSANTLQSIVSTMETLRNNFIDNWKDTKGKNADRITIIAYLNDNIHYYNNKIIPALTKLGNAINAYAVATEILASASADDSSLVGITPAQLVNNKKNEYLQKQVKGEKYTKSTGSALYDGSYTKNEFIRMVENFGNTLDGGTIDGCAIPKKEGYNTNMLPYADVFYDKATEKGLDPVFVFSIACQESGYGSSWNAVRKGNLFGMGAFDSNPSNAYTYDSISSGISSVCNNLGNNYIPEGGKFYTGPEISAIGKTYASDPKWAERVETLMKNIKASQF